MDTARSLPLVPRGTLRAAPGLPAAVRGKTVPVECELSEPASVRACVAQLLARSEPLDAIICNAGIMALPKLTLKYGYELQPAQNWDQYRNLAEWFTRGVPNLDEELGPDPAPSTCTPGWGHGAAFR